MMIRTQRLFGRESVSDDRSPAEVPGKRVRGFNVRLCPRRIKGFACGVWGLLLLCLSAGPLGAQEAPSAEVTNSHPFPNQGHQNLGMSSCYNCHANSHRENVLAAELGLRAGDRWIAGNEMLIWSGRGSVSDTANTEPGAESEVAALPSSGGAATIDRHAQAYTSLLSETAVRIGETLGRPAHRDVRCLACHSAFPAQSLSNDVPGLVDEQFLGDVRMTSGVSCEGCHGAAGRRSSELPGQTSTVGDSGWGTQHFTDEQWRYRNPQEKFEYGYADVHSVIPRTRLCLSCHSGNAAMGRVLTHEMYAAGHPPLPPFELETFQNQMPKHWREITEKDPALQQDYSSRSGRAIPPGTIRTTRNVLISALITFSESLTLTADLAEGVATGTEKPAILGSESQTDAWPELARFECYACHHDLRHNNWRSTSQEPGRPGRPRLHSFPHVLANVAFSTVDPTTRAMDRESLLRRATLQAPFGDRTALIAAARALAREAADAATQLDADERVSVDVLSLRERLLQTAAETVIDYDSARTLVWASLILEQADRQSGSVSGLSLGAERLLQAEKLFPDLYLRLQQGQAAQMQIPGASQSRSVLLVDPALTLPPAAAWEPTTFLQRFRQLHAAQETPVEPPSPVSVMPK